MSAFPYTTTSPPPTSGALTVVDKANESQPYAGGGGGPSGPNLTLSTLTLNPNAGLGVVFPNSGTANSGIVGYQDTLNVSSLSLSVNFVGNYADKLTNGDGLWSVRADGGGGGSYYADFGAGRFIVLGNNGGAGTPPPVVDADQNGQMSINAVSTINISTPTFLVNGQPVGGAVPPNLVVSSITVPSPANQDLTLVGGGGTQVAFNMNSSGLNEIVLGDGIGNGVIGMYNGAQIGIGAPIGAGTTLPVTISTLVCSTINGAPPGGAVGPTLGTSSITASTVTFANLSTSGMFYASDGVLVNKAVGISLTPLVGQYGNSRVVGAWGEEVYQGAPGWAEFATQRLYLTDNTGGATSATYIQNLGNTISVQTPGNIVMAAPTSVSSLTVSSINGAAPGGGGGGMVFSTVTIPGGAGSAFNSDPNVLNQVVTWPVIPNHVYNVNVDCRVQANAPTVTDGDNVYIEVLPNGGTSQAMDTAWGVQVSSLTTSGAWTQVGGSALFKAPVNSVSTCALGILGSFSTTVRVDSITYVDMGVI